MTGLEPFDVCGPLPAGTTVLEASAGTGKTFTIAALATRYVAEGHVELSQLMLVTFGRAATQELRERVRERLVSAERGLREPSVARSSGDSLLCLLAQGSDDVVAKRRERLTHALAGFDAATIATTHGFCRQMLAGLGVAGDLDPDATFLENIDDLVTEVVDDLYVRKYARAGAAAPLITYAEALAVARAAVRDPQARLEPTDAAPDSKPGQRFGLAKAVREEVEARKRRRGIIDYDDLLLRLRDTLTHSVGGVVAAERIRSRYRVVLVDEFQDTDPVQWEILRLAFHGHLTLVLIGDPKQAIYAFRGADVVAYLSATQAAAKVQTLGRNWRSDEPLLAALDAFFGRAALGDPRIVVHPVQSANPGRRLSGAGAPLRIRAMRRDQAPLSKGGATTLTSPSRELVASDLARDVVTLLDSGARLTIPGAGERVSPGDIAVLVRTNKQGALVRDALQGAGVPAVMGGTTSVFAAETAQEWLILLQALEQPHRPGLVRAAALTCFVGWDAERLAAADESAVDDLGSRLRRWADVLDRRGVAALLETITFGEDLPERMLSVIGGERRLTDLRHVAQTLHAEAVRGQLGITAVREWLQRRLREAAADTSEERSRRLESDAAAVQVVTVHGSKGLEFPVVYVPFGWDRFKPNQPELLLLHDGSGARALDLGGKGGPHYAARLGIHEVEESGEDLRLLYVALTRAQCQVVAWWAPSYNTATSSMNRLLFAPRVEGQPAQTHKVPSDAHVVDALSDLAARCNGALAVESVDGAGLQPWKPPSAMTGELAAAVFGRSLDVGWRRTSYSALTAAVYDAPQPDADVGSEPEHPERSDESVLTPAGPPSAPGDDAMRAVVSPMADLPAGAAFGTLVHSVLERVDTSAADLPAAVLEQCVDAVAGRYGTRLDPGDLAAGLVPVLETSLGPLAGGRRLADVAPGDRLSELDFELPLAGGDDVAGVSATLAAVGDVLERHVGPDDPLAGYAAMLRSGQLGHQALRGYLTGSIDAVLRLGTATDPRYVVVDYKTNWLGDRTTGEPLTAWDYRPGALAEAMLHAHYPLQALLYSVALHRFLRWRQPGYDPARHLGGVLYLFVRGMCGAGTPEVDGVPCGVFPWLPSAALVEELSGLLGGGESR